MSAAETVSSSHRDVEVSTNIPLEIPDVPWMTECSLGIGFDVITGEVKPSPFALEQKHPILKKDKIAETYFAVESSEDSAIPKVFSTEGYVFIDNTKAYFEELGLTSNLSICFGALNPNFSVQHFPNIWFSEQSMTVIYKKVIEDDNYKLLESPRLSEEAEVLRQENPARFRDRYGDYFVAGVKYGLSSRSFCTYTAKNRPLMEVWKPKIKAAYTDMTAPCRKEFNSQLEKMGVSISFSAAMDGISENYTEPIADGHDVKSAPEWFSSHATGKTLVLLRHYSCVCSSLLPRALVHPDAMIETAEILTDTTYFWQNLKFYENTEFYKELKAFLLRFETNRLELCEKPDIRSELLAESRRFRMKFFELRVMKMFILEIHEQKQHEPKKGRYAGPVLVGTFKATQLHFHSGLIGAKTCEILSDNPDADGSLKFSDSKRLVVGWRMEQIGKGSKRKWTTLEDHFLLSSKVEIKIEGKGQLKLTVCHVSREKYFFYNEKFVN